MDEFEIGQRVTRREHRETKGATVLSAQDSGDGWFFLIAYDEGGEGWWPRDALEAETGG